MQLLPRDGKHLRFVAWTVRDDDHRRGTIRLDVELDAPQPIVGDVKPDGAGRGDDESPVGDAEVPAGRRETKLDTLARLERSEDIRIGSEVSMRVHGADSIEVRHHESASIEGRRVTERCRSWAGLGSRRTIRG